MYLNTQPKVQAFLLKYPSVDIHDLDGIRDTLHYGHALKGKNMADLEQARTDKQLHVFAKALHIPNYMQKKKHVLKPKLIEKYRFIFDSPVHEGEGEEKACWESFEFDCCLSIFQFKSKNNTEKNEKYRKAFPIKSPQDEIS